MVRKLDSRWHLRQVMADRGMFATTEVVAGMAGGRAKRRRLAQALLTRPAVLTDGRSPAPEAAGKLLTALREAGAVGISAPVCAECGKALRAFQRRGQDWYCGVHGPQTAACTVCGKLRLVSVRDLSLIHISEPTRRTPISYAV